MSKLPSMAEQMTTMLAAFSVWSRRYVDGTRLDLSWGNPGSPELNGSAKHPWVRLNRGEWQRLGVQDLPGAKELMEAAENAVEAFDAITST